MSNKKTTNPTLSAISVEKYHETIVAFRNAVKNPDYMPWYDKSYGTKYQGVVRFETFVFYALLRNVDISKVTHAVESEKFKAVLTHFSLFMNNPGQPSSLNVNVSHMVTVFGLTREEMSAILRCHKETISHYTIRSI